MSSKARRVLLMSLLAGITIGLPGIGLAASDEDDVAIAATFDEKPGPPDQLFRVEWTASPARSGRARLEGSVHNDSGRAALNVQLRINEIDESGGTVRTVIGPTLQRVPGQGQVRFDIQVPDRRHSYHVAVAAFSFDFAEPAAR